MAKVLYFFQGGFPGNPVACQVTTNYSASAALACKTMDIHFFSGMDGSVYGIQNGNHLLLTRGGVINNWTANVQWLTILTGI